MTTLDVRNYGSGPVFVAEHQIFQGGEEFVEVRQMSVDEFRACADERFVPPTGAWGKCIDKLQEHRLLIIVGELGSGRRTAALRLLRTMCEADRIYELEPIWSRPRAQLLPPVSQGCGYLLDMSEPTADPPRPDFGEQLLSRIQEREGYLIVTMAEEVRKAAQWTTGIGEVVAHLGSPDARQLVESELRAAGFWQRIEILSDSAFDDIWKSMAKAADACRLAGIVKETDSLDPGQIVEAYGDWRAWIDKNLPAELDPRVLLWSCAFCDGGSRKSILRMAEALHRELGHPRTSAEILSGPPAAKRLYSAHIRAVGSAVRIDPARHGLAAAVRRHLWDEYEDQLDPLKKWIVNQAALLPEEDADHVVEAILELIVQYRDDDLLRRLRVELTRERRSRAVSALSKAALDPRFGAHVRGRLYTWLASNPSQELVDVVAEVCGGELGRQKPAMALVRLRRAALKTQAVSQALVNAFTSLAIHHPAQVLDMIEGCFADPAYKKAGVNAFLALASRAEGANIRLFAVQWMSCAVDDRP